MTLVTATNAQDAATVAPVLRDLVHKLDPNMPVFDTRTMQNLYTSRAVKTSSMIINCVTSMGLLGLALAMVGLYGLVAYSVSRRTREIGIRMAIGADRSSVLRMVIRQGLFLGVTGVTVGTAIGIFACRAVTAAIMTSSGPADPVMFAAISLLLLSITLLAAYAPARRASLIDPMRALRDE
jgi:putative ABC transport system permease protein